MRILLVVLAVLITSCANLLDIAGSLASVQKLQFKLASVSSMRLAGVDVSRIASPSSLSIGDGLALGQAFARKSLPASFTLNVDAKNPNSGSGKSRSVPLTLNDLQWRLLIDEKPTISGGLANPIDIPGIGTIAQIPLAVSMDLYSFFADKGYDGLLQLALALGGAQGSSARVKLDAMPTVGTPFGPLTYPNRVMIINTEFRGS